MLEKSKKMLITEESVSHWSFFGEHLWLFSGRKVWLGNVSKSLLHVND
ncbi:hypothetical protein EV03_1654 [Prochlorococcus marinus str. PAC1]|uniref:Uncharacterized protein n=1 Tax=Prochlorococcus marinus str. PAC1 TaxID=59924 RepID=A0A0A2C3P1_PROMR|nr:hypothetical protein EV03_1654 [Prochlorococcus marinus str. PAC1]